MNKVELINLIIEETKVKIDIHKAILEEDQSKRWYHIKEIEKCNERIVLLEQIKSDVANLEIIKSGVLDHA